MTRHLTRAKDILLSRMQALGAVKVDPQGPNFNGHSELDLSKAMTRLSAAICDIEECERAAPDSQKIHVGFGVNAVSDIHIIDEEE